MLGQYRDFKKAQKIISWLKDKGEYRFMHVCGTHQDTIVRYGLDTILFEMGMDVREGPGCPVCVTTTKEIESAVNLARHGITVAVYGDMLKAPGAKDSLATIKAKGGDVHVVYSVEDAIKLTGKRKNVVFFGVGFETTAPSTAVAIMSSPENFYVYSVHRRTPPAVVGIAEMGNLKLDGLILPGHVSTIIGVKPWLPLCEKYRIPGVVAGFEPLDVLLAIAMLVKQNEESRVEVENEYTRVVKYEGNKKAQKIMEEVFEDVDMPWRGFPVLEKSGMKIRKKYEDKDAEKAFEDIFEELDEDYPDPPGCRCAEVIRGEIYSWECPLFGRACTPEHPVGPCMVSSEGACAIEYKYGKMRHVLKGDKI